MFSFQCSVPSLVCAAFLGFHGLAQPADPPRAQEFASAEALLESLESADAGMKSLTADIVYDRVFELDGDRQTRRGKVYFDNDRTNGRRFAVAFDMMMVGKRMERQEKAYIFDGRYLVEKLPGEKLFVKREVVREGEAFDPLRIGEGPFPIPIGQKKDDILSRYEATLAPTTETLDDPRMIERLKGSHQLVLRPRSAGDEFKEIRVWYRADAGAGARLLPRMARTVNSADDVSTVLLLNVATDADIPPSALDTTPPDEDGWDVRVEPYRAAAESATEAK